MRGFVWAERLPDDSQELLVIHRLFEEGIRALL
jgi:hypothetical protein